MSIVEIEILNQQGLNSRIDVNQANPEKGYIGDDLSNQEPMTLYQFIKYLNCNK